MARRRKKKLPREAIECQVISLSHEGRGIAKLGGKTQFVEGALPGETVLAKYIEQRAKFDELSVREIISSVAERVKPPCIHAEICGGCSLQHMATQAQIDFKQGVLKEQFRHFGDIEPEEWQLPMTGPNLGYRGKARLGVRYAPKRQEVLVGFREKRSNFIADLSSCAVLDPRIGEHFEALKMLASSLSNVQALPQLEVAMGDHKGALILRHMEPLTNGDLEILRSFGKEHDLDIYLQPKGPDTAHKIWPEGSEERLHYCLSIPSETGSLRNSVELAFHPLDFTQVNSDINRKMVAQAMEWLDVKENERVLDLFCGLGNFTIPLATQAQEVVGVEGGESMVSRGQENAKRNGLGNVAFYAADLQADFTRAAWASEGFDKILIDPPRSGALDVVKYLSAFKAEKIVYVSCNPATLARDAGILIEHGYRLTKAGVMDMFPHTSHVESMALFEKS